jgi:hypothetical protein
VMVELAWLWTRYQPDAAQVCWFRERVGSTGPRVRKIMVVALARKLTFMAVVFGGILSTTAVIHANATTVDVIYEYPSQGTVYEDLGVQSLPASYTLFTTVEVTVTANQISVGPTPVCTPYCTYTAVSFNGFEIDYSGVTIASATLDSGSSLPGFTQSDISITSDSIFLNFESLTQAAGQVALIDVNSGVTATPLPAALPLFASGLGALGLFGWRRKRKTAASIAA